SRPARPSPSATALGAGRSVPAAWCMPSPRAPALGINHLGRRKRRGHRLRHAEGTAHDLKHLLAPAFLDRLQSAQLEPRQADAVRVADDLEAEVGEEVLREHRPVDAETLVARLALGIAVRERLEARRAAVARLADRGEEERLEHPWA